MENISVSIRIRPLNQQEQDKGSAWRVDSNVVLPCNPSTGELARDASATYTLDHVFDDSWTTDRIYAATTEKIVQGVVQGINGTVFAYGQTSSGKTFTMRGTDSVPGIIPRAVHNSFAAIEAMQDREFLIRVSYMELYNEDINDLLAPENSKLPVHETPEGSPFVAGLREDIVTCADQVLSLLDEGERRRHIGETKMNKNSSRSHTIFRMVVESRARDQSIASTDTGAVWVSALTLVDLAGSERASKTGAEGVRMKEGASINKSLLVLGNVINKLSEGVHLQGGHIPYRDSKLTRILQPSLGGNARTAIICNMTPAAVHAEESHSTLRFACRAKCVVNNAVVNEVLSDAAVLKRQAKEIEELRSRLAERGVGLSDEVEAEISRLRAQLLEKERLHELVACQLEAEKVEREKAQRKVDGLTRLMLEGARGDATTAHNDDFKSKRDRRLTWCPGKQQDRKRSHIHLDDLHDEALLGGHSNNPTIDTTTMSPAAKRHGSLGEVGATAAGGPAHSNQHQQQHGAEEMRVLQEEVVRLQEALEKQAVQMGSTQEALETITQERDRLLPQVEEVKWRARQLERERDTHATTAKELAQSEAALRAQLDTITNETTTQHSSLQQELEVVRREAATAREQLQAAQQRLDDEVQEHESDRQELERLVGKRDKHKQELDALREQLEAKDAALAQQQATHEELQERLASAEASSRDLVEAKNRLEEHVADLEKRKRAPLYQKKQEEELRAAVDKAQDAEARAAEAEARFKDAKAEKDAADKLAETARTQLEQISTALRDELEEQQQLHTVTLERLKAEHGKVEVALHEEAALLREQLQQATCAAEEARGQVAELQVELGSVKEAHEALQGQAGETEGQLSELQACVDAAAERIAALEEELTKTQAEHEAAMVAKEQEHAGVVKGLGEQLEAARLEAEATLHLVKAEAQKATSALEATLAETKATLEQTTTDALAAQATLDTERTTLTTRVAELQARVDAAAAALHAADELRELKKKHKQDMAALTAQLKSTTAASKGGEREGERLKKETDKLQNKIKSLEEALKSAKVEKTNALLEKANVERELKGLKDKAERLTKNLERSDSVQEKRRESMAVGLNKAKSALSETEQALAAAKLSLEQTQFALTAKSGECQGLEADLDAERAAHEELRAQHEEQTALLQEREGALEELESQHTALRQQYEDATQRIDDLTQRSESLQHQLDALNTEHTTLQSTNTTLEQQLVQQQQHLQETAEELEVVRGRLPEIEELQKQLTAAHEELSDVQFANAEATAVAQAQRDALEKQLQENATQKGALEETVNGLKEALTVLQGEHAAVNAEVEQLRRQVEEGSGAVRVLQDEFAKGKAYVLELEGQLAEMDADHTVAKTTLEQTTAALHNAQQETTTLQHHVEDLRAQLAAATTAQQDLAAALTTATTAAQDTASQLDALRVQHQEAEKGWESEMQGAVERATQWKEFADTLTGQRDAALTRVGELEGALGVLEARVVDLQQQLAVQEGVMEQLHVAQGRVNELETLLADRATAQHTLETQLADALQQAHDASSRAAASDRAAVEYQAQVNAAQSQIKAMESRLEASANEAACMEQQLHAEMEVLRGNADDVATQRHAAAQEARRVAEEHAQALLHAAHQQRDAAEQALAHITAQLQQEQQAHQQLQQRMVGMQQEVADACAAAETHRKNLAQALAELRGKALQLEQLQQDTNTRSTTQEQTAALHAELRKSKRREEKLNALVFRMRQDVQGLTNDPTAFDKLFNVRELEYELDFAANKAAREQAALQQQISVLQQRLASAEGKGAGGVVAPLGARDENVQQGRLV